MDIINSSNSSSFPLVFQIPIIYTRWPGHKISVIANFNLGAINNFIQALDTYAATRLKPTDLGSHYGLLLFFRSLFNSFL